MLLDCHKQNKINAEVNVLTLLKKGEKLNNKVFEQARAGAGGFCGLNLCYDNGCGTRNNVDYAYSVDYKVWWAGPPPPPTKG